MYTVVKKRFPSANLHGWGFTVCEAHSFQVVRFLCSLSSKSLRWGTALVPSPKHRKLVPHLKRAHSLSAAWMTGQHSHVSKHRPQSLLWVRRAQKAQNLLRMGKVFFTADTRLFVVLCMTHSSHRKITVTVKRCCFRPHYITFLKTKTFLNSQNIWLQGFGVRDYRPEPLTRFTDAGSRV